MVNMVCHDEELRRPVGGCHTTMLVFSAKESVFKAVSWILPYVDFHDIHLSFREADQTFLAQVRSGLSLRGLYFTHPALIITTTLLPVREQSLM